MFQRLAISFIVLLSIAAYAQVDTSATISVTELKQKLKSDSSLVILDVRTSEELAGPLGKIDKAINIPIQELVNRLNELEKFKSKEIAVICRTGRRSGIGTELLRKKGYNARNVLGGMTEYRKTE